MPQKSRNRETVGRYPEDWEEDLISECILVNPKRELKKNTVAKYVSMADSIENQKAIHGSVKRAFYGGSKFRNGDTLLARITPCLENGKTAYVDFLGDDEIGWGSTEFIVLSGKDRKTTNEFVYYLARSPALRNVAIQSMSGTSGRQRVQEKVFASEKITIPTISEQRAIAKILSDLDAKIELNRQMSGTLEEMAQAIFNHWFVDFEFPDKNGKPYKSSGGKMKNSDGRLMPVMWEQKKLGNTLSLLKDGSHNPPKRVNEGIRFIAGASDVEHFDIDFSKCTYISKEDCAKIHKYFELKENDALLTIVGTVGNVAIVKKSDLPFSLQRSIAILRAGHEIEYSYLYLFLNTTEFKRYIASRLNVTAQPGIYLGTLSDAPIIVPPRDVMEKFHKIASEIISSMQKNSIENRTLSSLRDSLLPKLMSGEIRVEGI